MKKLFNLILLTAALTVAGFGCKKTEKTDTNSFDNSVVVQGDRSQCKPTGPIPSVSLLGIWAKIDWRETPEVQYSSYLEFKNGTNGMELSFQNYCTVKSMQKSVLASVTSKVYDNATSLMIAQNLQKTVNDSIGGIQISCNVAAESGTYLYRFDGNCLVIEGVYYIKKATLTL